MIFIPYFSFYSLTKGIPCPENGKYFACKSIEMSHLLYLYIRYYFGSDEHIYFSDGCCPLGIEYLTEFLPEKYEFIDKNSYTYNKDIKVHIKRFDELVIQEQGVNRRIVDFLKFAYLNNLDYLAIDMDSLIAYNLYEDFNGYDFGARIINLLGRTISSSVVYISANQLHNRDNLIGSLFEYCSYIEKTFNNDSKIMHSCFGGEGGYFRNFCYGKIKEMSYLEKHIHEVNKDKLIEFIANYPVKHKFVDYFLRLVISNENIN